MLATNIDEYVPTIMPINIAIEKFLTASPPKINKDIMTSNVVKDVTRVLDRVCLLYTSPSPRDLYRSRMPSSA